MSKQKFVIALCAVSLLLFILGLHQRRPRCKAADGPNHIAYRVKQEKPVRATLWPTNTAMCIASGQRPFSKTNVRLSRYARFDGATWSNPNDIYVTGVGIKNVSPVVDQQGTLHIAWAEGLVGPAYYTHAPANNALSAQNWAKPIQIDIPARTLILRVDSKGVFHILYINQTEAPGVYYIRSEDQGDNLVGASLVRPGYSARSYSR